MDSHGVRKPKLSLKRRHPPKLKKEQETAAQNDDDSNEVQSNKSEGQCEQEGVDTMNIKKIKMEHVDDDDFKIPTINIKKLKKTRGKET